MGCRESKCSSSYSRFTKSLTMNYGTGVTIDSSMVTKLKEKVISEFSKILNLLEKGHKLDYEFLLQEVSLVNLIEEKEISLQDALFYLEFYLNNEFNTKWQTF